MTKNFSSSSLYFRLSFIFFLVFPSSFFYKKKTLDEDDDSDNDDDDENTNTKNTNTNCCEDCDDVSSFTSSCASFLLLS